MKTYLKHGILNLNQGVKNLRVLVITVGGSPEPIVNAVSYVRPDFVFYICSAGEGERSSKTLLEREIIPKIGQIPHRVVLLDDPDDFINCFKAISQIGEQIQRDYEDAEVIANYTGGTKTMTAALAVASMMNFDWELQFNKGPRVDLVKVKSGDLPVKVSKWDILVYWELRNIKDAIGRFQYAEARNLIEAIITKVTERHQNDLIRIHSLCCAFDAWDRFDHSAAYEKLRPYASEFSEYMATLGILLRKPYAYERIGDLVMNAQRRAVQSRYDDAVARLYRALELLAQIRVKQVLKIKDENEEQSFIVPLDVLPDATRDKYREFAENGKLKLGLYMTYVLLADMRDVLGEVYNKKRHAFLDVLKLRNYSILAHGLKPLTLKDYERAHSFVTEFVREASKAIGENWEVPQLPRSF